MTEAMKEKANARKVLAILIGLLATFLALEGLASVQPGGFEAFAQAASPTGPAIKLMNPDSSHSSEISNKNDGVDQQYHLVAWVTNSPSNAIVEFKYIASGATREDTICSSASGAPNPVTFVSPDTYECKWGVNVADGAGTIRAELFSETTRVAFDEEKVTINNQSATFTPANPSAETTDGDTVEILYPTNGGEMGFYTRTGGAASGVLDVSWSAGTRSITVYYSTSPPGTEPAFRSCGTENTDTPTSGQPRTGAGDGVRCNLPADNPSTAANERVTPGEVTAMAARANGAAETGPGGAPNPAAEPQEPDSGDAHRALGYEQDASTVTLNPQTQDNQNPGNCSGVITGTVLDLRGRRIVGHNVDVHATGPTDALSFDDSDTSSPSNSSAHKPADGHQSESAIDCESTATTKPANGAQGEHEVPGDGDIKHIESTDATGTNDKGEFRFQLFSPVAGVTQFTMWADEDQNDRFCGEEAHAHGSIGWAQTGGTPTGAPTEETSCPKPSPGATPGTTPTGTPTGTPSQTPSQSPTQSPGGTECSDGQDNDRDGAVDMEDPDCDSPEDDSESPQGNVVTSGPCEGFEEGSRQPQSGGGEIIVGTQGPDSLTGTDGDDLICGLGGRDSIRGLDGDDRMYGGGSHDNIRGTAGNDSMYGGRGLDVLRGGSGDDLGKGQGQDDALRGYTGKDRLIGGGADDTIRAGDGNDYLAGNAGDDILAGAAGRDTCRGGGGKNIKSNCER